MTTPIGSSGPTTPTADGGRDTRTGDDRRDTRTGDDGRDTRTGGGGRDNPTADGAVAGAATPGIVEGVVAIVGADHVLVGDTIPEEATHDESLTVAPVVPRAVVRPADTAQVAAVVSCADRLGVPVTARGNATGLSGGCVPDPDGIVVSFERLDRILEIDTANHVAVVQAGVTLEQLNAAVARHGLVYPVFPGESSATLGGNVATNAGGMRAVKYGVTRHHVLGLEMVLASGEVVRTGGKLTKTSSGYDLTQLVVGSEGTLALVTEVTVKLQPLLTRRATVLAPFATLAEVTAAVPVIVGSGAAPLMLEYIDMLTMAATTEAAGVELGVPEAMRAQALAYLVVALENTSERRVDEDVELVGGLLAEAGALEVFVLPPGAADDLISARERAFFVAKAAGADDIVDVVVPRAAIAAYLETVAALASEHGAWVAGCGHAGDGNVHLSVFQADAERRRALLAALFEASRDLGGVISGEHGLGRAKQHFFLELEDPVTIALLQRIKAAFDPRGTLGPGVGPGPAPSE
jgi:glycolate oxidase